MTLKETYYEKIIKANEINFLVRFIFQYEGDFYYVEGGIQNGLNQFQLRCYET